MLKSRKTIFTNLAAGALAGVFSLLGAALALSPAIEQAKNKCVVGEQADGYLGFVAGAKADDALRRDVRDVNQARKSNYGEVSARNGVSIDVTASLTAEKLIGQARSGQCVRDQSGQWVRV